MDKMRKEMWERAKLRAKIVALKNASERHPAAVILYDMDLIEQKNLIFGSQNTRRKS